MSGASIVLRGYARAQSELKKALQSLTTRRVATVGIHASAGKHKDSDLHVAEIGAIQHFGTDTIPARPFLDNGIKAREKELARFVQESLKKGVDPARIVEGMGALGSRYVVEQIDATLEPPLKPATIMARYRRHGAASTHPLIDTGQLRQSITFEVHDHADS